jgi:hypothetical protein
MATTEEGQVTPDLAADAGSGRSPLYEAMNAERYQRQNLIREVQQRTGRKLICYVTGRQAQIDQGDVLGFEELLSRVIPGDDLDLLLHTRGGDINVAEKLLTMVRSRIGDAGAFRVVVPHCAKSAGTLLALGADCVVMSDTSELGPIDPQIAHADKHGVRIQYSAALYINTFTEYATALKANSDDPVARIMLEKLDPVLLSQCRAFMNRAAKIAEGHLSIGMFRTGEHNRTRTASMLLDINEWLSHGQMINHAEAAGPKLGLVVEYVAPTAPLWQLIWRLFCTQTLIIGDAVKLYESDFVSLNIAPGT